MSNIKTIKSIQFKDLPGWEAKPDRSDFEDKKLNHFKLYNDKGAYVGFYSDYHKCVFLVDSNTPQPKDCKNLHAAMRYAYLKTKKPNSKTK